MLTPYKSEVPYQCFSVERVIHFKETINLEKLSHTNVLVTLGYHHENRELKGVHHYQILMLNELQHLTLQLFGSPKVTKLAKSQ